MCEKSNSEIVIVNSNYHFQYFKFLDGCEQNNELSYDQTGFYSALAASDKCHANCDA